MTQRRLPGRRQDSAPENPMVERRLGVLPAIPGVAGPAAFQRRLQAEFERRGIGFSYQPEADGCDALLVIGGTRHLGVIRRLHRRGIPVFHRLDGMNWIHRRRRTGWRHALRAEASNRLMRLIRDRLADAVVYQSEFARHWWETRCGAAANSQVICNGVPLDVYRPEPGTAPPQDRWRLLVVEGNLAGGYEQGLEWAVALRTGLASVASRPVELAVAGRVSEDLRRAWERRAPQQITWLGLIAPEEVVDQDRRAHVLFSTDIHPACPNSVIEALACGLPVVGFDTGALRELVTPMAGKVVPYGGNAWQLDAPDLPALVQAAREVLADQAGYRAGARQRAEAGLGVETMAEAYLETLGWQKEGKTR
jgi:glycosyltransferase involved in cell wall biosynthesis